VTAMDGGQGWKGVSSGMRGWVPKDPQEWQILVISLILGVMVQVQVTSGNPEFREKRYFTALTQNLPPDYRVDPRNLEVEVILSGGRSRLANLLNEDVDVFLKFDEISERGGVARPILIVRAPPGIEVVGGNRRVNVPVERWITKALLVEVFFRESAPEGVQVVPGEPEPPQIAASGPLEKMESLEKVEVIVNLGSIIQSERLDLEPLGRDKNGRIVRGILFDPPRVHLEIQATTVLEHRVLIVLPEFSGALADGHFIRAFSVDPPRVVLEGSERDLRDLVSLATVPIPLDGREETFVVEIALFAPLNTRVRPESVTVAVEVSGIVADVHLEGIPLFVRGGGEWRVDPGVALVVVRGPVSRLSTLTGEEIRSQVRVEVPPCPEGEASCVQALEVSLPPGLALKSIDPESATLTAVEG